MSFSLFVVGFIATIYSWNNPKLRSQHYHILFAFYCLMELLQTIQYLYIQDCNKMNKLFTNFAYILVIVQPILWNIIFYKEANGDKYASGVFLLAIALCAVWIVTNVMTRLTYNPENPFIGANNGTETCTKRDSPKSHLYWKWTSSDWGDLNPNYFMHICIWVIPALIVPQTRITGSLILIGAIIGLALTNKFGTNIAEFPSSWCLISIPLLLCGAKVFMDN